MLGYVNGRRRMLDAAGQPLLVDARIPVRYSGDQHLLLVAPSRTGKDRDVLIPTLLTDDSSYIVLDPKGQALAVTGWQRMQMHPGRVFVLDPVGLCARPPWNLPQHSYNPLASISFRNNPRFFSDILALAASMVPGGDHTDGSNARHFVNSARGLIAAIMMGIKVNERRIDLLDGEAATLPRMRQILSLSRQKPNKRTPSPMDIELELIARSYEPAGELVRAFINNQTEETDSVFKTAGQETIYLSDPIFARCLARSDFSFRSMKERRATVYIVLPDNLLDGPQANWMRLLITAALRELTGPIGPAGTVTFLMNEFYSISAGGALAEVSSAMGRAAGSGNRLWPVFQDVGQIEERYKKVWTTFLANCGVIQAFTPGPGDTNTIRHLSESSGSMTVGTLNYTANSGLNASYTAGGSSGTDGEGRRTSGTSWGSGEGSTMGDAVATAWGSRPVLRPDDLRGLPLDESILFVRGAPFPARIKRSHYDQDSRLAELAMPDPYHMPAPVPGVTDQNRLGHIGSVPFRVIDGRKDTPPLHPHLRLVKSDDEAGTPDD